MGASSSSVEGELKFGPKTTAEEVATVFPDEVKNKHVIITGANSGLGLECARVLARRGAKVILACRSKKNGDEAIEIIKKDVPDADVTFLPLDLSSFASIRAFSQEYHELNRPLHILLNNAGVMACPFTKTTDGLEMQWGVNHMGHFYLTSLLWDLLVQSGTTEIPSRIVNVSSIANFWLAPHNAERAILFDKINDEATYDQWHQYGSSKLANILFTREMQRRSIAHNVPVVSYSLHPGVISETKLTRHDGVAYYLAFMSALVHNGTFSTLLTEPSKNIPQGSSTSIYCVMAPLERLSAGGYYSHCEEEKKLINPVLEDANVGARLWSTSLKQLSNAGIQLDAALTAWH